MGRGKRKTVNRSYFFFNKYHLTMKFRVTVPKKSVNCNIFYLRLEKKKKPQVLCREGIL